jgi:hypothetical protein
MPRTRKVLSKQNLKGVPVLVKDTGPESSYFNVKQLNSVFTGGKNSFLISGTPLLRASSEIFIELIDSTGKSVYVEAIRNFSEAGARLVSIEIYENTPRGRATLSVVGTAAFLEDGSRVPQDWADRENIRWERSIIIEPKNKNITPIRLKGKPQILVNELLLTGSVLSQTTSSEQFEGKFSQKLLLNKPSGYTITSNLVTPFSSDQKNPRLSGFINVSELLYTGSIPSTTESVQILSNNLYPVDLPLDLLNSTRAFTDTNITSSTDGRPLPLNSIEFGTYELTTNITSQSNSYIRSAFNVTGSVFYLYNTETADVTNDILSFANIRIVNLDTVSGQIYRIKTSNRDAASDSDFSFVADTPTIVGNLLVINEENIFGRERSVGEFTTQSILTDNWYAGLIEGDPATQTSTYRDPNISGSFVLVRSDEKIMNGGYAETSESNYFFGTQYPVQVFGTSEYTLEVDFYIQTTSGSVSFGANGSKVDIYLIGSAFPSRDPLGVKIGEVSSNEDVAFFRKKIFNFVPVRDGELYIRFVTTNGFWQFANIKLSVAEEYAFSPDEVSLIIKNDTFRSTTVIYKSDFYDINNDALDIEVLSPPEFFTGSTGDLLVGGTVNAFNENYRIVVPVGEDKYAT